MGVYLYRNRIYDQTSQLGYLPVAGSLSSERGQGISPCSHKRKCVIEHEACYQTGKNEPNIDKCPAEPFKNFFKKVKKKLVTP